MSAERLRRHYTRFLATDRVLLTGHSHQAWPDVARDGVLEAFDDAARHVDDKWQAALGRAERVREGVVERIGGQPGEIALGQNTHELVTRFLSALDFGKRRHLVTTSGEFHSLDRQLRRLSEGLLEVSFVEAEPVDTLAARLAQAVRPDTAALLASTVLFETSSVVPGLAEAVRAAHRVGAAVLLDAYHAFNVVPFRVDDFPGPVFVVAGGYKYAQWGEGCCFLRVPPDTPLRPVLTGWFSDFARLEASRGGAIGYGPRPADVFAGSTYDPTSHYRAARVIELFREEALDVARLREISLRQTARLLAGLEGFDVATPRPDAARGGFVSVRFPDAARLSAALRAERIWVDARGQLLRLGPAPYTTDAEIELALATLRRLAPR